MGDWNSGYVTDIDYVHGVYREQLPTILAFAGLISGVAIPDPDKPLVYCDLGCGQGYVANLIAAAYPNAQVYGIDYNPAHIVGARSLADEAGLRNVHFLESSFAECAADASLPEFDIIALHGIYSWISPEDRRHIVDIIRKRLRPGGVAYISYNTLPGWAALMPLRRLIADKVAAASGPTIARVEQAFSYVEGLRKLAPLYFSANPSVAAMIESVKGQNRHYVTHEFYSRDAMPSYHADVAAAMSEAKLTYVGSANLLDHLDEANFLPDQREFLAGIADATERETMRDYFRNQQFRRDIFVKGAIPLSSREMRTQWMKTRFILTMPRSAVPLTTNGSLGEVALQEEVYGPILDALADGTRTTAQLLADPQVDALGWERVLQALMVLVGAGFLDPALNEAGDAVRRTSTRSFNLAVLGRALSTDRLQFLVSPVSGSAVSLDHISQLFLLALHEQRDGPEFVWDALRSEGVSLSSGDAPLQTSEENLALLRILQEDFNNRTLHALRAVGVV